MSTIDTSAFYDHLTTQGVELFTGVPDSLLQDLCACIYERTPREANIVAANEGNAVGIACGYHVSTGKYAAVYLQNSGLGNIVNPVLSLAHSEVYSIPMLLIIGWRGEPGVKDEPQHVAQGRLTPAMLDAMEVPYTVVDPESWETQIDDALALMRETNAPVALLVRKGIFSKYPFATPSKDGLTLKREEALAGVLEAIGPDAFVVSTTGKTSREVFELREGRGEGHARDFLTVGGMGHSSSIAMGACLGTEQPVYCIDGDGGFLMHTGAAPVIAQRARDNFRYILINNGAHESVGGQPTVAFDIDIPEILRGAGFEHIELVTEGDAIAGAVARVAAQPRSALIIETQQGSRADLGRPTVSPSANKVDMLKEFEGARR
ncbi:phosphonopyruvate decarboxylase [Tessaracoccus caeni]|uniref:phosphonopyruvate decarboxylase n=1 Tax=Tessaracoccus caeni TaxID=3031239 RepID=UPI0023DBA786|nr:phosphonopyruvate decarboxylase [Tessaracoccus caeni]MDF1489385.1 phosphonopyruvate decarboxylase [Tessaracoccus caeni]